jgi:hypothetical protein
MAVRRSLPQPGRSLIGAWCFIDHYGPDEIARSGGMHVLGHPHTGLATVSWLFAGTIEHRDTTGVEAIVRPGELNLMTAGAGIAHSEHSTAGTTELHGVQLWVALPEATRFTAPGFEHFAPELFELDGVSIRVFLGALGGGCSPVRTHSPLVGAEVTLPEGRRFELPVDPRHEHGFLCDTGALTIGGACARPGELIFVPAGPSRILLDAGAQRTRLLVLGGKPFGESIVMWWNFIGRTHEEIVEWRAEWQRERESRSGGRFGDFPGQWQSTLPAPELPNVGLRPRR